LSEQGVVLLLCLLFSSIRKLMKLINRSSTFYKDCSDDVVLMELHHE
jgi:hypothetical protein